MCVCLNVCVFECVCLNVCVFECVSWTYPPLAPALCHNCVLEGGLGGEEKVRACVVCACVHVCVCARVLRVCG